MSSFPTVFRQSLSALLCFAAALGAVQAAPMVQVGTHPTSSLSYPSIHTLRAFDGRIYMGTGDYNYYPAVTLTSYDPATHRFINEHSVNSDSIERLRVIGDTLFAPSTDPIHYEDFKDYTYRKIGGPWRDLLMTGSLHLFDMARTAEGLFAAGGNGLWRSIDDGKSWTQIRVGAGRYYWCYALGGRVYVPDGYWANSFTLGASGFLNNSVSGTDAHTVMIGGEEVALIRSGSTLYRHNIGASPVLLHGLVSAFTWSGGSCYTLEGFTLVRGTFSSPTEVTFTTLPVTGIPSGATSIEVLNGKIYVATSSGTLWVGNLDGSTTPFQGAPAVVNAMPEQFGRGLAWDGDRLLVGSPDASPPHVSAILGGRVQQWNPPSAPDESWTEGPIFTAPIPDYSGWFGKDLCVGGDYMAIVETGRDTSNRDRGSSSVIHLYLKSGGTWVPQTTLAIPFVHSVSILNGLLAIGSANPAANQAAGMAGVHLYRLTQDNGTLTATFVREILAGHSTNVYKPTSRVLLMGDWLIGGFAGDPSRSTGKGLSALGQRTIAGDDIPGFSTTSEVDGRPGYSLAGEDPYFAIGAPRTVGTGTIRAGIARVYKAGPTALLSPVQFNSPVLEHNAEFGTAVGMGNSWLLVGAPGAERSGRRHAGRVFAYRRNSAGTYELRGEIPLPPASEGEFGIEIASGPNAFAIGSRFSTPGAPLEQRVMIVPNSATSAYDFWASAKGVPGGDAGMTADLDGDGQVNLVEYASDTNPKVPDASSPSGGNGKGAPFLRASPTPALVFHRPTLDPLFQVTLHASTDLGDWQEINTTSVLEQSFGIYERRRFDLPVGPDSARFYRLLFRYVP